MDSSSEKLWNPVTYESSSGLIYSTDYFEYLCSVIRRQARPPFDYENLAQQLWLKALEYDRPLYQVEIRHAVIDVLRGLLRHEKLRERSGVARRHTDSGIQDEDPTIIHADNLEILMENTPLGALEKMVIYLAYYEGLPNDIIGERIGKSGQFVAQLRQEILSKLRSVAVKIFTKDSQ